VDSSCGWMIPRSTEDLIATLRECYQRIGELQIMGANSFKKVEERIADWSAMHYEKMFDLVWEKNEALLRNVVE